jgi:hypothetical protein
VQLYANKIPFCLRLRCDKEKSEGNGPMGFELSYGDIGILFFLTLGPLKAKGPSQ